MLLSVQMFLDLHVDAACCFSPAIIEERDKAEEDIAERDERIGLAAESANLALWTIDFRAKRIVDER